MMRPFKWLVVLCMRWWIEDRAARRKEADQEIERTFFAALSHADFADFCWKNVPQRLRYGMQRKMRAWIEEQAKNAHCDLLSRIENVRRCGVTIDDVESRRLITIAMDHAWRDRQLPFAHVLYGERIPIDVLLTLVDPMMETAESFGNFLMGETLEPYLRAFFVELDPKDAQAIERFLWHFAEKGNYEALDMACDVACMPCIPRPALEQCFRIHLEREKPNVRHLVNMCRDLKDWETANTLIAQWTGTNWEKFAATLALAIYQDSHSTQFT